MAGAFPRRKPAQRLSKKWLVYFVVFLGYVAVGVVFFKLQNWEQCFSRFTGNACAFSQMFPVFIPIVGLAALIVLFLSVPMHEDFVRLME
jgi:hypothetical protein